MAASRSSAVDAADRATTFTRQHKTRLLRTCGQLAQDAARGNRALVLRCVHSKLLALPGSFASVQFAKTAATSLKYQYSR